jgi:diguanylate cyclase (GGDEF)-like protein
MWAVLALHAVLILILRTDGVSASRLCTAAIPALAALCSLWRAQQLPLRERISWRWLGAALLLWAAGQTVETLLPGSGAASNLAADPSDFLYLTAAFPLLLAIANTTETESIRSIFYLELAQVLLAGVLTYIRLFRMPMSSEAAASVMLKIYAAECALLAVSAVLRLVSWSTLEERRRMRLMCSVLWMYLPIELSLDHATKNWHLQAGTLLDLLWSGPFLFAGWQALHLPMDAESVEPRRVRRKSSLLIETLCPMLITTGIFALAASLISQHPVLGLASIFLLLLVQGLHGGIVQLNYLAGQNLLLEREQELEEANAGLEQLSRLDPLTGVANRRQFSAALDEAWKLAIRRQGSIGVLMIDIDHFKGVNDFHGHAYGDECLTAIARILSRQGARANDLLARYGGEEFVLLLTETDFAGAMAVAERMHHAVEQAGIANQASPFNQQVTVSIGVGLCAPKSGTTAPALVEIADQALYEAKRLGRNRICARSL